MKAIKRDAAATTETKCYVCRKAFDRGSDLDCYAIRLDFSGNKREQGHMRSLGGAVCSKACLSVLLMHVANDLVPDAETLYHENLRTEEEARKRKEHDETPWTCFGCGHKKPGASGSCSITQIFCPACTVAGKVPGVTVGPGSLVPETACEPDCPKCPKTAAEKAAERWHTHEERSTPMAIEFTKAQREQIGRDATGKVIKSLEWSAEDDGSHGYWVMTFTDGTELCFRMMAELVGVRPREGTNKARDLLELALKAYREDYPGDEHDASTFLDFVFTHLWRMHPKALESTMARVKALGAGNITNALLEATKGRAL